MDDIGDLGTRHRHNIALAEQAEAYIKHKARQQSETAGGHGSLSDRYGQTDDIMREFQ